MYFVNNFCEKAKVFIFGNKIPTEQFVDEKRRETINIINRLSPEQRVELVDKLNSLVENNNVTDRFSGLCVSDFLLAFFIASTVTSIASLIDSKGKCIEKGLNKCKLKQGDAVFTIGEVDNNNPFDFVSGKEHRYKMFHDCNLFKAINSDFILRNGKSIEDFMNGGKKFYTLIELIEKKYNITGFSDVAKIVMMHYAKDVVTPEGLPLMFTSIFTRCEKNNANACGYSFYNKIYENVSKELVSLKLSDINSYLISKLFINSCSTIIASERAFTEYEKKNYTRMMKIIVWTLIICFQMLLFECGAKNGGRLNLTIIPEMIAEYILLIKDVNKEHYEIVEYYKMREKVIKDGVLKDASGV